MPFLGSLEQRADLIEVAAQQGQTRVHRVEPEAVALEPESFRVFFQSVRVLLKAQFGAGFCAHQEYCRVSDTWCFDVLGNSPLDAWLQRVNLGPANRRFLDVKRAKECVHRVVRGQPRCDRLVPAGMRLGQV